MKAFWFWLINLQWHEYIHKIGVGIGTLCLGFGGILALYQTGNVLEKVTNLQKKVDAIEEALIETKVLQKREIGIIKYNKVNEVLLSKPQIFNKQATRNEVEHVLSDLTKRPSGSPAGVYLPKEKIEGIINNIEIIQGLGLDQAQAKGKIKNTIIENLEFNDSINIEKEEMHDTR